MVFLLTPDDVKQGPSRAENEQRAKVRALGEEETRLVIAVNDLHEIERSEKARVDESTQKMRNEFASERVTLGVDIRRLTAERAPLLIPIANIQKEADDRNEESKKREDVVSVRESRIAERESALMIDEERLTEKLEDIADKQHDIAERDEASKKREERAIEVERQAADSLQRVNDKWLAFHEIVAKKEVIIIERENAVNVGEKANTDRTTELDKQKAEQLERERRLVDGYATLESAKREILQGEKGIN